MKKSILLMIPVVMSMLISCGSSTVSSEEPTSETPTSIDVTSEEEVTSEETTSLINDDFEIEDVKYLYLGGEPEPLKITGTEHADEIVYEYDDEYIEIDENKVEVIKNIPVALEEYRYYYSKEIKVKATLGSVTKEFTVLIKRSGDRDGRVHAYQLEQNSRHITKGEYALVMGDSFFDKFYGQGWPNFYNDFNGKIFNSGIGGSTFEEWFDYLPKLVYAIEPTYIAVHLGSNDFWDLRHPVDVIYEQYVLFMERVHARLPDTKIIFFSVENRGYLMPQCSSWDETIGNLNQFNALAKEYADNTDYITYFDSFSYLCYENGMIKGDLFYPDTCHPLPISHNYYGEKIVEAGVPVTFNKQEEPVVEDNTPEEFTRTTGQGVLVDPVEIKKDGTKLNKEFVVSGEIEYSYTSGSNAHFEFGIGTHFDYRLLLWNNPSGANTLKAAAVYGGNHGLISSSSDVVGTSGTFTFKLLISNKSCYLFINDTLKAMLYNYLTSGVVTLSSEYMNINASNIKINVKGDTTNVYESLLGSVATYEDETSTTPCGRVF